MRTEVTGLSLWAGGMHGSRQAISDVVKRMTFPKETIYMKLRPLATLYMNLITSEHAIWMIDHKHIYCNIMKSSTRKAWSHDKVCI